MAHVHGVAASGDDLLHRFSANGKDFESGGVVIGGALSRFEGARCFPVLFQDYICLAFARCCLAAGRAAILFWREWMTGSF